MTPDIEVQLREIEPSTVAFIDVKGPYSQMAASFDTLYGWIGGNGLAPSGPPSGVFFNSPDQVPVDELRWELRSPIAGGAARSGSSGGPGVKRVESYLAATALHRGPYEEEPETYRAVFVWMARNGYEIAGPQEEVFITNPAQTSPQDLLTEIRFPVRQRA